MPETIRQKLLGKRSDSDLINEENFRFKTIKLTFGTVKKLILFK